MLSTQRACDWACAQVQCITHFLQLPIEDEFLADLAPAAQPGIGLGLPNPGRPIAGEGAGRSRAGDGGATPEAAAELIPFADAGNPVMAQARCIPGARHALFITFAKLCRCSTPLLLPRS